MDKEQDSPVKVVDRRWWARNPEPDDTSDGGTAKLAKPTYVEEMEHVIYQAAKAACARIFLDAPLSEEALAFLRSHEHVLSVTQVAIAR